MALTTMMPTRTGNDRISAEFHDIAPAWLANKGSAHSSDTLKDGGGDDLDTELSSHTGAFGERVGTRNKQREAVLTGLRGRE